VNVATFLDGHPADDPALIAGAQVTTYGELAVLLLCIFGAAFLQFVILGRG